MTRFLPGVTQYDVTRFAHDKTAKQFTAEASSLGMRPGYAFGLLYEDALDSGLAVYNPATGQVTYWYVYDGIADREGDTIAWELMPVESQLAKHPALKGYSMMIYND